MKSVLKTSLMAVLAIFSLQFAFAQTRLVTDFNSTISGRSINVLASGQFHNRHELGGGIRFNINKSIGNDDQLNLFKKRMFATKPLQYFGIEGFYQIHFLQTLEHIDLFAFYDAQLCYSTTRTLTAAAEYVNFGPFFWLEQNIGIGFTVDIWKNLFLTQRLGGGTCFIMGKGNKQNRLGEDFFNLFGYLYSVGIGYRF